MKTKTLIFCISMLFAGVAVANGAPHHIPVNVNGLGCWRTDQFIQLEQSRDPVELVRANPLQCELQPAYSNPNWMWAEPCTGCLKVRDSAHGTYGADIVSLPPYMTKHPHWYITLPDGKRAYSIGKIEKFNAGMRMLRVWVLADSIKRQDGKSLP